MDKLQNPNGFEFFDNVAQLIEQARKYVGRTADLTKCIINYKIGHMIVEEEQGGKARAVYGKRLLAGLSAYLNNRVGRGFSETTLKYARQFYKMYSPSIGQALPDELKGSDRPQIGQAMLDQFGNGPTNTRSQAMISQLYPFTLSWSHYMKPERSESWRTGVMPGEVPIQGSTIPNRSR